MNKTLLIACVALAAVYVSAVPVQTEETIGEWRDYVNDSWDHNLRIVREGDQYTMVITPTRGRVLRRELIARGDGNWEVRGSTDREGYRITLRGDLLLYDSGGGIRTAEKVQ